MATRSKFRRTVKILRLFAGFMWEIAWNKVIRTMNYSAADARLPEIYRSQAIRFRETALSLEGLLIKVGQFFSTRVDVLPKEYTSELAKLQDEVPPIPVSQIRQVIAAELGQPVEHIFAEFDDVPVAAASLGQVHHARLWSGEEVAVKALRPGIEKIIDIDLKAFRGVIWMLKAFTDWEKYADIDAIYEEFSVTLHAELDYNKEYANIETFRQNFKDERLVYVPKVYSQYSRQRVLTMEFVGGYKITDIAGLRSAGINVKGLAQRLIECYLKQALIDGFYHADPHPGNLFIRPDGGIIFIDFGMVGRISKENMRHVRMVISGLINTDAEEIAKGLQNAGFIKPAANTLALQKAINVFVDKIKVISFEEIGDLDIAPLLEEIREFLYTEPFQVPANYSFLGRAVGTLAGISAALDPEMNAIEVIRPYGKKILGQDLSATQLAWTKVKSIAKASLNIPTALNKSLKQLNNGDIHVKVEFGPVLRQLRFQQTLANRLVWAILLAATGVVEAVFVVNGRDDLADKLLYALGALALLLLNNMRKKAEKPLKFHSHSHRTKRE